MTVEKIVKPTAEKTFHTLSDEQTKIERSEHKSLPKEDKRKVARQEHINGSTPKSSL